MVSTCGSFRWRMCFTGDTPVVFGEGELGTSVAYAAPIPTDDNALSTLGVTCFMVGGFGAFMLDRYLRRRKKRREQVAHDSVFERQAISDLLGKLDRPAVPNSATA